MQELKGKVAVITGAASGIGRAMARALGAEGMNVMLADIEAGALEEARSSLEAEGVKAATCLCDVSQVDAVGRLAEETRAAFGSVHVLCNNAGVFAGGTAWGTTLADYEWILGVNVWGIIHGLHTFVPILLEQDEPAHIVNTASMAGLTSGPMTAAYFMSKHAAVSLSESLFHELSARQSKIGVSVVCPELIATRIGEADRNRPQHLKREDGDELPPETTMVEQAIRDATLTGADPSVIANRMVDAIRENRFWVVPPPEDPWRRAANHRCEDITTGRNPSLAGPAAGE
jgi:NAD(P)-dependent dehydrogenase (short-subunit alcohol dehydrogenase family)